MMAMHAPSAGKKGSIKSRELQGAGKQQGLVDNTRPCCSDNQMPGITSVFDDVLDT